MSDSDVYIAERIISERNNRGVKQYLIKWKGYSMKDSTWEPVGNIICPSLLTTFENEKKAKKNKKLKTTQTPTNGHSSQRATKQSKSQSPRQQTPPSTSTPEPQPKLVTPRVPSSPVAQTSSSSPKSASSPSAKIARIETSPSPNSNQSSSSSSPGFQLLNHDPPKSPKLPQRSQTPLVSSPKPPIDNKRSQPSPRSESSVKNEPPAVKSPATNLQPALRNSPAPTRQVTTKSPMMEVSTTVQLYIPQPAISNQHADSQIQVAQPKNRKFAVMNTVITDVTVNNHTITISESKTNQGFFKEGNRNSVDATTQF